MSAEPSRAYTVTWSIGVCGTDPEAAVGEAIEIMRRPGPRPVNCFGVYDVLARTAVEIDMTSGASRAIPYWPRVDVVVDHDHAGTEVHVFVQGTNAEPDDLAGPAVWHILEPGSEDENPDHAWYRQAVTHAEDTPRPVQQFINRLAMGYHRCGIEEDCASADAEGAITLEART
ncbi:hypothetical protein [Kitasatospora sp. NPDC085464]|uniref:hypothetical protein n=1 Tax=Kitasatospora sp. NPDC085464 TaxID=3364063 RepID=UPI0037C5BBA0